MSRPERNLQDQQMDQALGNLLRAGVILSATVVFLSGIIFLHRHGQAQPELAVFHGEPTFLRVLPNLLQADVALRGRAIIQLGVLLLILTPVARVGFSFLTFVKQGDRTYIIVTLIVLVVLLHSLLAVV
jgi:uncharacterized membrane protein